MNIEGLTPQAMENADYLNVYYAVDGGQQISISENRDGFAQKTISASNVQGNSVVFYIQGRTSWDNVYECHYQANVAV